MIENKFFLFLVHFVANRFLRDFVSFVAKTN